MIKEIDYTSEAYNNRADEFLVNSNEDCVIDTQAMLEDLTDTITASDRVFLCANEIGYPARAVVIKSGDNILEFLNPVVQKREGLKIIREQSMKDGKEYLVPRFTGITLRYLTKDSEEKTCKFGEDASILFSRIMNCLDAIHHSDIGLEILPEFDQATEEERQELVNSYLEELQRIGQQLDNELSEDEETKRWWTSFKFNKAKERGEIETEVIEERKPANRAERRLFKRLAKKYGKGNKK